MVIGIDASRAFLRNRTGIEEYAHQVIAYLRGPLRDERVVLYVRGGQSSDFELPESWELRRLRAPRFWTHIRLSLEMLLHPPDVLFVPAHTVPLIHARKSVVTVHGLEYEFSPESYSRWERFYMRSVIRFSCCAAETVIAVSENTKRDLMRLYGIPKEKIRVVYEGKPEKVSKVESRKSKVEEDGKPYLLFIGRIEERKNVRRIVEAFGILKKRYGTPLRLVLAGKPGYGYADVKRAIGTSEYRNEIVETGYVDNTQKSVLLENADIFVFPSLYEGFGLPVIEAQASGVPVVTSDISSLPEVAGKGAVFVGPLFSESIADGVWQVLSDRDFRDGIIKKGRSNAERFDWAKCAGEIADILRK
ncbi:MAG TPA: glycosyltransferase family 1 protein [Candidatus Fimivivens sp.]|nr:glycosyltransferase family 1 protein [Candidatus Fimivivens sp.]